MTKAKGLCYRLKLCVPPEILKPDPQCNDVIFVGMYWEVIRTLETFAKSQGTQRPAITWLGPADLCGGAGSQGVIRVELLELTRLKKIQIWLCSGRSQHRRKNGVCWPYGRVAEHRDNGSCPSLQPSP